jgi:hypothetical protein
MKLQNKITLSALLVSLALAATAATTAATSTAVSSNTSAALNDKVIKAGTQSATANQQHSDYCKQRYGATATDATNLADVTLGASTTDAVLCTIPNSTKNATPGIQFYATAITKTISLYGFLDYDDMYRYLSGTATTSGFNNVTLNLTVGDTYSYITTVTYPNDDSCSATVSTLIQSPSPQTFTLIPTCPAIGYSPDMTDPSDHFLIPTYANATLVDSNAQEVEKNNSQGTLTVLTIPYGYPN